MGSSKEIQSKWIFNIAFLNVTKVFAIINDLSAAG